MKLSSKLIASFSLLLCSIIGLGCFSIFEMSRINDASQELGSNWLPTIRAVATVNDLTSKFRRLQLVHELTESKEAQRALKNQMTELMPQIEQAIRDYEKRISEPEERENYPKFLDNWKQFVRLHEQAMDLSNKNEDAAAARIMSGDAARHIQAAQQYLDILVDVNDKGGMTSVQHSVDVYASGKTTVIVAILAALVIGAALAVWLIRNVLAQLGEDPGYLQGVAEAVAGGDLDVAFRPVTGQGGVYGVFVAMVGNLKSKIAEANQKTEEAAREAEAAKIATARAEEASQAAERAKAEGMLHAAGRLEGVVSVISSASDELSAQVEQSTRGSETQARRVAETATAMEEMNATVLEVAKNAAEAAETSGRARAKAEEGAAAVVRVVTVMEDINRNASQSLDDMGTLGKEAEGIGHILNVISDIADQTNLLALNAAIEAARAGEAGRGFAVVADEVRKLAEKTMTATKEVGDAIRSIQDGTRKNYDNVAKSVAAAVEAAGLAGTAGQTLGEIVSLVETTADQVRSIATASEQQSATSEEISRSIEDINRISTENADGMRQSAQAVASLADQTRELSGLIVEMQDEGGDTGTPAPAAALPGRRAVRALR